MNLEFLFFYLLFTLFKEKRKIKAMLDISNHVTHEVQFIYKFAADPLSIELIQ